MKKKISVTLLFIISSTILIAQSALSGNYTISIVGGNYSSFSEAVDSLKANGIDGPVVFSIEAGTYEESFEINAITGSSEINTISFIGDETDTTLIKPSSISLSAVVVLDNSANLYFENIFFQYDIIVSSRDDVVAVTNGSKNISFKHCEFIGNKHGFLAVHINNADSVSLDSCKMYDALSRNIDVNNSENITITNCQIDGAFLYIRDNSNVTLMGNTVNYARTQSNATASGAILLILNTGVRLENNYVYGGVTKALSLDSDRSKTSFVQLYNNVFQSDEEYGGTMGFSETDTVAIFNNTYIGAFGGGLGGGLFSANLAMSELKGRIQNNLFIGKEGPAFTAGAYFSDEVVDYNAYVTDTSLYNIIRLSGIFDSYTYTDLAVYQNDFPSMDVNSRYISTDLASYKINSATNFHFGRTDLGINEDIEGDPRGLFGGAVDVGADEWSGYVANISKISGTVFFDENGNGEMDNNEEGLANQQLLQLPDSIITTTNNDGEYCFYKLENVDYTIVPFGATNFTVNPTEIIVLASADAVDSVDFGYEATSVTSDFDIDLTLGTTRCFRTINGNISYTNQGVETQDLTISFTPDDAYVLEESTPSWDSEINGTYSWNLTEVGILKQGFIYLSVTMPGIDEVGEMHTSTLAIENTEGILDEQEYTYEFVCAYDPNDKSVFPEGFGDDNLVLKSDTLEYLIRFQNTGNDTAFDIRIQDQLSADLDLNTFEVISASHSLRTEINKTTNQLIFYFDDIQLVDSVTNESDSHGYVKYRIAVNEEIADSTVILNTAYIYFDFNPPIVTNTVSSMMVEQLPEEFVVTSLTNTEQLDFQLYPNPTNGIVNISLPNSKLVLLEVINLDGTVLHSHHYEDYRVKLDLKSLPAGMYIIKVQGENYGVQKKLLIR